MRILLVTTGLLTGGAEMQIAALAGEYVRQGHTVAILNLLGQTEITVHPAVHMERLHLRAANATLRYARLPAAFRQASRFIAQWQPDVVHSHMVKMVAVSIQGSVSAARHHEYNPAKASGLSE